MSKNFIYVICPVTNLDDEYKKIIEDILDTLGILETCYLPYRDNPHQDVLKAYAYNVRKMRECVGIVIFGDKNSHGIYFDAGMATALRKPAVIMTYDRLMVADIDTFKAWKEFLSYEHKDTNLKEKQLDNKSVWCPC